MILLICEFIMKDFEKENKARTNPEAITSLLPNFASQYRTLLLLMPELVT